MKVSNIVVSLQRRANKLIYKLSERDLKGAPV